MTEELERYTSAVMKLTDLELEKEKLKQSLIPEEIREKLSEVDEEFEPMIAQAQQEKEIAEARQAALALLDRVPQDHSRKPLKIGIIGEIYVVLEPAANHYIQLMLGEMGVETDRSIYLSSYTRKNTIVNLEGDLFAVARPYLNEAPIGGHGANSIAETILYARHGFDGVVQLAPFSCIPEVVAKSIIPAVSRDFDIPVQTIFIDEQTGKAGVQTRLEAFVDLLQWRRDRRERVVEKKVLQG